MPTRLRITCSVDCLQKNTSARSRHALRRFESPFPLPSSNPCPLLAHDLPPPLPLIVTHSSLLPFHSPLPLLPNASRPKPKALKAYAVEAVTAAFERSLR
eukprot:9466385-Pyramimonas_sp.AAC.1